jgi:hypothetical protein
MRATRSVQHITISSIASNVVSGDTSYENPLNLIWSIFLLFNICKVQNFLFSISFSNALL